MPVPHHFFLSLKSFTYNTIGEDTDVFFSLYDVREGKQIRWDCIKELKRMEGGEMCAKKSKYVGEKHVRSSCDTTESKKLINHKLTAWQCVHENMSSTNNCI